MVIEVFGKLIYQPVQITELKREFWRPGHHQTDIMRNFKVSTMMP
jgi:hypothetical protein